MAEQYKTPRLMAAAKEFAIGSATLIDFLVSKGFHGTDLKPSSKLTEEMYRILQSEFESDKLAHEKAMQIDLPKGYSLSQVKKKKDEEDLSFHIKEENSLVDDRPIELSQLKILDKIDLDKIDSSTRPKKKQNYLDSFVGLKPGLIHALKLVTKCLQEKNPYLELGNCDLIDEDFIEGGILDSSLKQCKHLNILIFSNEWAVWGGRVDSWKEKLSKNSFLKNYLNSLPTLVASLSNLTKLICCGDSNNNWQISNIESVKNLKQLTYLDLSENKIEDLNSLENLEKLKILYLFKNRINNIGLINKLKNLSHLNIHSNNIKEVEISTILLSLKVLNLQNNKIKYVEGLSSLPLLKDIYLSKNEIEELL